MKTTLILIIALMLLCLLLSACAPGNERFQSKPAGFFWGIWHGWIAPVSLIWHLFDHKINIYEPNNTGFWYQLGFYGAIVGGFGSLSLTRRKKKCCGQ